MYLSGFDSSATMVCAELLQRSKAPATSTTSVKSSVVITSTAQQSEQLSSATPRTRSGGNFWSGIKLLGARVSQNFMALIYTGRLKSTLVENFKKALQGVPSEEASPEEKNLWWDKVYCGHNDLLDIGCSLGAIRNDLKSVSSLEELEAIEKDYGKFSEDLASQIGSIASRLVSASIDEYCRAAINGDILLAHSLFKHMERLFLHIGESESPLREIANRALGTISANLKIELKKALYRPGSEGKAKIDARLKILKEKLYGMARPIMDRQESRIISSNVETMLSSISTLSSQLEKKEKGDVESVALPMIRISFLMRSDRDLTNIRKEVCSQLISLRPEDKKKIENFHPSKSGNTLFSKYKLRDEVKNEIKYGTIEKAEYLVQSNKNYDVKNISENASKIFKIIFDENDLII